ncbi:MAG: glycosidase [Planctomycetota bacterium]
MNQEAAMGDHEQVSKNVQQKSNILRGSSDEDADRTHPGQQHQGGTSDQERSAACRVQHETTCPIFQRAECNPILTADELPVLAEAVLNPGAGEHDGRVFLLLRVEQATGYSNIHVAWSDNGTDGWQVDEKPLLEFGLPEWRYEQWGVEDARATWLADEEAWYITYTAYSPAGAAVGLAKTTDFVEAERIGLIFSPNNKDAVLFPRKFQGRYAALHRPDAGGGIENIWIAYSRDLLYWGEPHCVLREHQGPAWDAVKVGAGPPPVETDEGWLLLYHGVKAYGGELIYRVGAALLDRDDPYKMTHRSPSCIMKPREHYEMSGLVPNVVFPTGLLHRGDELWMYYGCTDTSVALATAKLSDVLGTLEPVDREK